MFILIILIPKFVTSQISESDTTFFKLDSVYYRYQVIPDTSLYQSSFAPVSPDVTRKERETLRISGVKDFSFDMNQGFDQGLKVNITGEFENVRVEGNLSDRATSSSTVPISELEKMNLKVFTKNFYGGIGNLTLDLPFGVQDEIQGSRIGIHSGEKDNNISASYAVNRGAFKRIQFEGEEGKQSPYFLDGSVIAGSERVYLAQGIGRPIFLKRDEDYDIDYDRGIVSFTNKNIITNLSRIEVEYQQAIEDYQNIYAETDGQTKVGGFSISGMYRRKYDDRYNPLTFTLSSSEIESLKVAGDSLTVLHTYADTSSEGSYVIEDNHFVFAGEGNGEYDVTFFYVGENKGEYIYDPNIDGFLYQGAGLGNYSPKKYITPPQQDEFYACAVNIFETLKLEAYGSNLDKNTFSSTGDNDNYGKGGKITLEKALSVFSIYSEYVYYGENLSLPAGREYVDYQYQWNTQEPLEQMGNMALGIAPTDFLKLDLGYGILNRKHKRKFVNLRPFFFQFGYEGIDDIDKFYAGLSKRYANFSFYGQYENQEELHLFNYDVKYFIKKSSGIGISGSYDKDTTGRGITTVFNIFSSPLSLSLGHRSYNDTTFLFGNAAINFLYQDLSIIGNLQQSQRYSQKRDETFIKVDEGEGNYVYDPVTNTYIEKDGGDYVKKVFLLDEFEQVITRSYNIECRYAKSFFDMHGRFNYLDEENYLNHAEDFSFTIGEENYNLEFDIRQDITDDARYALFASSLRERLFSVTPYYKTISGRVEIKEELEKYSELEIEKRRTYSGEVGYNIIFEPLLRPKISYSYNKIFSQFFEELDIILKTPSFNLLLGIPIKKNRGRIELNGDLIYRIYNIDDVPYFFTATEPPGLTKILGFIASLGFGKNTMFSLIYKIEFPPEEKFNQNLRFQTKIRF